MDASLLTLPLYGYVDGDAPAHALDLRPHPRAARPGRASSIATRDTDDGLPPGEGAFGICSFWAVECLARGGDVGEAHARPSSSCSRYANDVGLFAEEIDPDTGAALGNFPQAFTHVGLINAALTLAE